jgi:hypothetical protein
MRKFVNRKILTTALIPSRSIAKRGQAIGAGSEAGAEEDGHLDDFIEASHRDLRKRVTCFRPHGSTNSP